MGEVYEAEETGSGRRVALKVLAQRLVDPEDRARFLREGRLAAAVSHPNSVYVFGTSDVDGTPAIEMELVDGGNLHQKVREEGPMGPAEAVVAILQVVSGLEAAAEAGILHRDVKPSNCFVDRLGGVKVGDYGLSRSTVAGADPQLTSRGEFLGTLSYASPEQVKCEELDLRSDIYSVGATLYFLLTGQAPFADSRAGALIGAVLQDPPRPLRERSADVPEGLERIVLRCLAKRPDARYPDYAALRGDLEPFVLPPPTAADLVRRAIAWQVDELISAVPIFGVIAVVRPGTLPWSPAPQELPWSFFAAEVVVRILYLGLLDGTWGTTPGKAAFGLAVVGPDRRRPGLARAFLRAALLVAVLAGIPFAATRLPGSSGSVGGATPDLGRSIAAAVVTVALLFGVARRRTGWAGLHETVSGTRVVLTRKPRAARPVPFAPVAADGAAPSAAAGERIGPYGVLSTLREEAEERLVEAWDEVLQRRAWIRVQPAGAPALPDARREVARPTRLRWLGGRRDAERSWDAFEAPAGRPFEEAVGAAPPWAAVRRWLRHLAEELAASLADGSLPARAGAATLWTTPDGRACLLDFPAPRTQGPRSTGEPDPPAPADFGAAQEWLGRIAGRALGGGGTRETTHLPLHAGLLLDDLAGRRFEAPAELVGRLREIEGLPPVLTRGRRALHLALASLPLVVTLLLARGDPRPVASGIFLFVGAGATVPVAALFRGGIGLRLLGIAVLGPDGREVSEMRAFARTAAAWSPVALVANGFFTRSAGGGGGSLVAAGLVLLACGAAYALFRPSRSLQDLVAGTRLVPR